MRPCTYAYVVMLQERDITKPQERDITPQERDITDRFCLWGEKGERGCQCTRNSRAVATARDLLEPRRLHRTGERTATAGMGQQEACRPACRHDRRTSTTGHNRCSAAGFCVMPFPTFRFAETKPLVRNIRLRHSPFLLGNPLARPTGFPGCDPQSLPATMRNLLPGRSGCWHNVFRSSARSLCSARLLS
jgi:hypothetical protein